MKAMSFLSRLFKPKALLPSATHPIFGRMQAVIDYGDGVYFWEVSQPVETPLGKIEPAFDAPASGPSDEQTTRWHEIIEEYKPHRTTAAPLLRETLAGFQEEAELENLELASIGFHDRPNVQYDWELAYETSNGRIYTVLFVGEEPQVVTVDG